LKRRRVVRILVYVAAGIAALLVLLGLGLAFLVGTQTGTRFLFARLGAFLPGTFAVRQADGRIDSPLTLSGVTYKKPGMEVTIDRLYLEWRLHALLERRLDIGRLYADGVHVVSTPSPGKEPTQLPDLDLHFNIIVRDARVRRLTLGSPSPGAPAPAVPPGAVPNPSPPPPGAAPPTVVPQTAAAAPLVIDEIDLKTSDIRNRVRIDQLAVRSALLRADLSGTVQPQGDYPVDLNVRWAVRPPGPPVTAEVVGGGTLTGTLASLHVEQALTAPFDVRLAAVLTQPLRDLRFAGRLAFTGVNPRRLRADLPDLPASGLLTASGSLDRFTSAGTVEGTMEPAGRFRVDYQIERQGDAWQVRQANVALPGTPVRLALSGRIDLPAAAAPAASGANGPNLDADLHASWTDLTWPPRGKASFASPRGAAHLVAHARGPATTPGRPPTAATSPPAGGAGGASAAGSLTSEGSLQATVATVGPLSANYRLHRDGAGWRLDSLDLGIPGTATHVAASGRVTPRAATVDLDAALEWRALRWPLTGPPQVTSAQGRARVAGSLDSFHAQVSADLAPGPGSAVAPIRAAGAGPTAPATRPAASSVAPGSTPAAPNASPAIAAGSAAALPAGHFDLAGNGGRDHFHLDKLAANLLAGHVQGHGDVAWSPRVRWDLALTADGINPAAVRPDLPGRLGFDLATRGESLASGLQGTVDLPRLQGTLRGQPVAASAAVGLAGASYDISHLDAHWGTAHLAAKGRAGDRLDLTFDAAAPNLGLLLAGATGSASAQGHVSGPMKTPRVQATLQAQGLRQGAQSLGSATVRADVDLAAAGPFQIDATLREISAAGQLLSQVTLASRGTTGSHTLEVAATGLGGQKDARVTLGLRGGLSAGAIGPASTWRGQITRLDLRSSPVGDWSMTGPATLAAGASAVDLRNFCWANTGGGRICASAAWSQAGTWAGEATLTALPLNLMKPFLPADLTVTGAIDGSAKAHGGSRGIAAADVDLSPGPGDLRFPVENGRAVTVHFERGSLKAQAGPAGGDVTAALSLQGVGTLSAHLRLPRLTQGLVLSQQPLAGTVAAHLRSLAFLEGFVPEVRDLTGTLNADLTLSGTAAAPRVAGQARLDGAGAKVPLYGLDLKNVRLTATGNGGTTLAIDAAATSSPGTLQITGTTGLLPSAAEPVHLTFTGSRFAVMNTRDIRILVSPRIDLGYQGTQARVTGEVAVPEAHIHVDSAPKNGPLTPSKDVVFVGAMKPAAQQPAAAPLALYARVRLVLPNPSVELDALGLKGQPYGSLLLVEEPGRPSAGTGELDIAQGGTFQAYGQNLTIERGRLVFGGPLDDPGLDIRASRLSDDQTVTAGIEAKGTLKEPKFSVWSTPTMGQSDALAYVVLGHGLNQASAQDGNRVANAATSLGLSGAGLLAKNIASRFGLEEATIESSGNLNQASLVVGKYLAPHLYVLYGIGLFQPINTFRIRYILSSKWTLQAESSTETGADILYTLERGRTK
jgi:translocation and assembly module TamB